MSVTAELREIFDSMEEFKTQITHQETVIDELRALLKQEKAFRSRLEEKLEASTDPDSKLDGWDEEYLFQKQCHVKFKWKTNGVYLIALKPMGHPTVFKEGKGALRRAVWEASGRKG